jgi:hypothetical protein
LSNYILETDYEGSRLKLEFDEASERAVLIVNGIVRAEDAGTTILRPATSLQTGYEWHELVEGIVKIEPAKISASIRSNKVELVNRIFLREVE